MVGSYDHTERLLDNMYCMASVISLQVLKNLNYIAVHY